MLRTLLTTSLALLAFTGAYSHAYGAEKAHWIWSSANATDGEKVNFRKSITIDGKISTAVLVVTADNQALVFVNGLRLG
jgi:hypothetical protein